MFSENEKKAIDRADDFLKKLIAKDYQKKGAHHIRAEHITTEFIADEKWYQRERLIRPYLNDRKISRPDMEDSRGLVSFFKRFLTTFRK